jgi:hypothetical protein
MAFSSPAGTGNNNQLRGECVRSTERDVAVFRDLGDTRSPPGGPTANSSSDARELASARGRAGQHS